MKRDTLLTISQRTGYSISTVSRVLSGKGRAYRISQKTIDLVTEIAKSCNYRPDMIAQSLRTNKTNTIGLMVPNIENPFFANLAGVIINQFKKCGYNIILVDTMESAENEAEALNSFVSRRVDGVVAVPVSSDPSNLEEISKIIPVFLIDRYFKETHLPYVCTDNYYGAYMATEHLIKKGYKNILAVQGVQSSMPNKERVRGYLQASEDYAETGVRHRMEGNSFSVENGYSVTKEALTSDDRPDAIFTFSTTILLGAINAVRDAGLKIPDDIAVISFDNNKFLDFLDPPITRIAQSVEMIGKLVLDNMLKLLESDSYDLNSESIPQILVRPTLIERRSC